MLVIGTAGLRIEHGKSERSESLSSHAVNAGYIFNYITRIRFPECYKSYHDPPGLDYYVSNPTALSRRGRLTGGHRIKFGSSK